jgi:thiamine pyrophosphokinase
MKAPSLGCHQGGVFLARTILIVAGGVASAEEAREAAKNADYIIAADGGFSLASRAGLRVDLLVGDMDSLDRVPENVPTLKFPREKDATDLELALDYACEMKPERIFIVGAFGARLDHTLANANLLEKYDLPVVLFHQGFRVYLVVDELEISAELGDLVSLIPLSAEVRGIFTWGLRYPLHDGVLFRASTRGVSNEVVGLPCGVRVREGKLLLIHKPKGGGR